MANAVKIIPEGFLVLKSVIGDITVALPDACDGSEFIVSTVTDDDNRVVRITFDFNQKQTNSKAI